MKNKYYSDWWVDVSGPGVEFGCPVCDFSDKFKGNPDVEGVDTVGIQFMFLIGDTDTNNPKTRSKEFYKNAKANFPNLTFGKPYKGEN